MIILSCEVKQVKDLKKSIEKVHIPRWSELPNIDLYMDQVLNYIEENIPSVLQSNLDEACITKTMINNYVKHGIISAPQKKKYGRLSIAELFVITFLKQVYSIGEIHKLMELAIETSPADIAYNHFCDVLEESLLSTFSGEEYAGNQLLSDEQYLLKNVVQTFVNKLYVQLNYLKKDNIPS